MYQKPKRFCGLTGREVLISANVEAGFFHLALAFTLLTTISFLEEDHGGRDVALILGFGGYVLLSLNAIYAYVRRKFSFWFGLISLLVCLTGLGLLASYVQMHIKGVFPITLSTQYNHPNPIPAPFNSNLVNFSLFPQNYTLQAPCKREVYKAEEYQDWFQCLRTSGWQTQFQNLDTFHQNPDGRFFPKGLWRSVDTFGVIYLWQGNLIFCLLTCFFHFLLAWGGLKGDDGGRCVGCKVPYWYFIRTGIQPFRWLEYSITSAIMIVLVLSLNRVTDIYTLAFTFIILQMINSFGAAIDYTSSPFLVAWYWVCSGSAFIWVSALLAFSYHESIQPYLDPKDNTAHDLWAQIFSFITPINIGIIVSFSSFALNNAVHQCRRFEGCFEFKKGSECGIFPKKESAQKFKYMYQAEIVYILLSFISKGLLVIIVSFGATSRER